MTTINPNDNSKPINDPQGVNDGKSGTGKTPSIDVHVTSQLEAALIEEEEIRKLSEKVNENTNNIALLDDIYSQLLNYKTNASDPNAGSQNSSTPQVTPSPPAPPAPPKKVLPWTVRDGKNPNVGKNYKVIKLDNGYEVVVLGNSQWQVRNVRDGSYVTFNANGVARTHKGGKFETQFSLHNKTTFILPDRTKITYDKVNGKLTITQGQKAVVVSNMINNKNPAIVANLNGKQLDANTNDSHVLIGAGDLSKWSLPSGVVIKNGDNISWDYIKNEYDESVRFPTLKPSPTPKPTPPPPPPEKVAPWSVQDNKDHKIIKLDNGYEVVVWGNSQWQVRNTDDGSYVTFYANGLVKTNTGTNQGIQFTMHNTTTFVLPDGTKITNEVFTKKHPKHKTISGYNNKLTITRGQNAAVVSNLRDNSNLQIDTNLNGKQIDANTNDSHVLFAKGDLSKWAIQSGFLVPNNGHVSGTLILNEMDIPLPSEQATAQQLTPESGSSGPAPTDVKLTPTENVTGAPQPTPPPKSQPTPQPTPPPKSQPTPPPKSQPTPQPTPPPKSQPTPPPTQKNSDPTTVPINQILSPENLQLLKELGIKIYDASGTGHLTKTEIEGVLKQIEDIKETLKSISNLDMVKLQSQTNRMQMHFTLASQSMKTFFNTAREIIRNI